MLGRNGRNYSYTLLRAVSFLAAAGAWKAGAWERIGGNCSARSGIYASVGVGSAGTWDFEEKAEPEQKAQSAEEPKPAKEPQFDENIQNESVQPAIHTPVTYCADTTYFGDALFIGDSRTIGLHEYGDLGNAEVIADSGMSVYKIFGQEFQLSTGEKGTLEELLAVRKFGKIYIMLGINELGYQYEATVSRYEEMLERIQKLQPDAVLFLEANLHITGKKSEASPIYNNENINQFNEAVAGMADDSSRFYLDVNELFDDEEGNLGTVYTVDDAHVLGKYYSDWVDWILEHAVKFSDA